MSWINKDRPGFFGRNRDKIIAGYNQEYGEGLWRLMLAAVPDDGYSATVMYDFESACKSFYEYSYYEYLRDHVEMVDELCKYSECYDNAETNVKSGFDYTVQEAFSTHIQDIAVRNALKRLGRSFAKEGPLLKIRGGAVSIGGTMNLGEALSPANVPYHDVGDIIQPSKCPIWANEGSVEDFWQSNKVLQVKVDDLFGEK